MKLNRDGFIMLFQKSRRCKWCVSLLYY